MKLQRPIRLVVGLAIAALAIWQLVLPAIGTLRESKHVDRATDERARRDLPVQGTITHVRSQTRTEYERRRRITRDVTTHYIQAEATPPGAAKPVATRETELPEGAVAPKRGEPITLWYDPQDLTYLTTSDLKPGDSTMGWLWLFRLIAGISLLGTATYFVMSSFRRPQSQL